MKLKFGYIILFISLLLLIIIFSPFWRPILWGIIGALLFYPLENRLIKWIKYKKLSSFLTTFIALVLFVIPLVSIVIFVISELSSIPVGEISKEIGEAVLNLGNYFHSKLTQEIVDKINIFLSSATESIGKLTTHYATKIVTFTYSYIVNFIFSFIVMFYLLLNGDKILKYIRDIVPAKDEFDLLLTTVKRSIHATVYGGLLCAGVQGILGAIGFLIIGFNSFFLWFLLIAVFSFLPLVGTSIVWGPVALFLLIKGSIGKAIFLILWGGIVVGLSDNYIRPVFIGERLHISAMLMFFSIIGGLFIFGTVGILIGPVVLSVAQAMVDYLTNKTGAEGGT